MTHDDLKRADGTANAMGCYITAYARINLYEIGIQLGADNLLYCDTDSWKHTNSDLICPNEGTAMGDWALEQEYDHWESVAPKQYKYHAVENDGVVCDKWKVRIKGCSMRGIDAETVDLKGEITFWRVIGIKESWRSDKHEAGDWILTTKDIGNKLKVKA